MLSKIFGLFKSKPVEKQPEPPLVQLGPEKTETPVAYELIESPTSQQIEDAFKEEELVGNSIPMPGTIGSATIKFVEEPKYEKDDGALTDTQVEQVTETVKPVAKKRTPRKTVAKAPAKKVTKNGKSNS
jgi:hypothetical protein